jgi:hypothetical protein
MLYANFNVFKKCHHKKGKISPKVYTQQYY